MKVGEESKWHTDCVGGGGGGHKCTCRLAAGFIEGCKLNDGHRERRKQES
jgi:hypothetical protein